MKNKQAYTTFERFVRLFTIVTPGEGWAIFLYSIYSCMIVASYYLFKNLREALLLTEASAEDKSYATALSAIILLFFLPFYAKLVKNLSREKLIIYVALAFSLMGYIFSGLVHLDINISYIYYVWVSLYGVIIITQFWVFTTGSFSVKSGKRIFPVILIGSSLGGLLGTRLTIIFLDIFPVSIVLIIASSLIALTSLLPKLAYQSIPKTSHCIDCHKFDNKDGTGFLGGINVVFHSKFLLLIAIYAIFLNIINGTGEYIFSKTLQQSVEAIPNLLDSDKSRIFGQTYAQFAFWVTSIALFLQLFVTSRIINYLGIPVAIFIMPILVTMGYSMVGFFPIFGFIYILKILDNSLDYSITNTVRQTLFLPVSNQEKFEGKTAIDTLFWRLGDLMQAILVYVLIKKMGWDIAQVATFCGILGLFWVIVSYFLVKEYQRRIIINPGVPPKVVNPIDNINVIPGTNIEIFIPEDMFEPGDPADKLDILVQQKTGRPLPRWLAYYNEHKKLTGKVPSILEPVEISLIAIDNTGLKAEHTFYLCPKKEHNN